MNSTRQPSVLIVGCGDVGNRLATMLMEQGSQVWGLRRNLDNLAPGIHPVAGDFSNADSWQGVPETLDYLVFTGTASERSDEGYRRAYVDGVKSMAAVAESLAKAPRRLFFTSSTAVYNQGDGEWVDELSETQPQRFNGQRMLEAEQALAEATINTTSVRLSGIYGPGRERLIKRVLNRQSCEYKPAPITNRIHSEDCAGVLAHLITRDWQHLEVAPLYIASDSEPCAMDQIMAWLADQLDVELPKVATTPSHIPSKRCSNQRLRETGYQLRYPDFRAGYGSLLQQRDQ
ncbi:SDR family oxidoreductase [Aestuariirhabdus sp. Z084]|uniref:SDR family oxidoreductase n=1 Tax=Aestuariirhabdus haliotis TaxID=2918751 RepID=UPI00201B413F|nr:SDR family oxidoreductase [Aestuariirhabdus haliotis]MCL6414310.1 SDR family oxidoreductase [Aestuariirhabdus haliotis]MCL6418242.1 SDR family oxidoreductase [Aestuariirhabdus haliotis]